MDRTVLGPHTDFTSYVLLEPPEDRSQFTSVDVNSLRLTEMSGPDPALPRGLGHESFQDYMRRLNDRED